MFQYTLRNYDWAVLVLFISVYVVNRLSGASHAQQKRTEGFYESYRALWRSGRFQCYPRPAVFGWVWGVIYPLSAAAVFLYYLHDDAALGPGVATYDHELEIATWVLIIFNLLANYAWNFAVRSRSRETAAYLSSSITLVVALSAGVISGLIFYQASCPDVPHVLYFSGAVFALYSAWGLIATCLGFSHAANIELSRKLMAMQSRKK